MRSEILVSVRPTSGGTGPLEPEQNDSEDIQTDKLTGEGNPDSPIVDTVKPQNRGGIRNRQRGGKDSYDNTGKPKPYTRRSELICRYNESEWKWEVLLLIPEEREVNIVRQNGTELPRDGREYDLKNFSGILCITYSDSDGKKETIDLFDLEVSKPLIFKMNQDWRGDGQRVPIMTEKGFFIVIVPSEWTRKGTEQIEKQSCADTKFLAHHFVDIGQDKSQGFEECEIPVRNYFQLSGDRIVDDSEHGDLFIGSVPKLKIRSSEVFWARVGEERKNGWRGANFRPSKKSLEEVMDERQGRFFLRIYNEDVKLLDSIDFRYHRTLREIKLNGKPYSPDMLRAPTLGGHKSTTLQFVSTDGTTIRPILKSTHNSLKLERDGTVLSYPDPDNDEITCSLQTENGQNNVEVLIKLQCIWWKLECEDDSPSVWYDKPLCMTRQKFLSLSRQDVRICLLPKHVREVKAGFTDPLERKFPIKEGLKLKYFADFKEIYDLKVKQDKIGLQVKYDRTQLTLIHVTPDPQPVINYFNTEPSRITVGEKATLSWDTENSEKLTINPDIGPDIDEVAERGRMVVTPRETITYTLKAASSGMNDAISRVTITVKSPRVDYIQIQESDSRCDSDKSNHYRESEANPSGVKRRGKERSVQGSTERVVQVRRVAKVVKGGRNLTFTALVVMGDVNGKVGIGLGRAPSVPDAVRKGSNEARKTMESVVLNGGTIPHEMTVKFSGARVFMKPAAPGTGVIAGANVRAVMEVAGVADVLTKSLGSSNPINVVKATLKGLRAMRSPKVERKRRRELRAGKSNSAYSYTRSLSIKKGGR